MSLQMVLAGLFPPENTPMEWNMMMNWQPIPIYTEPEETDTVNTHSDGLISLSYTPTYYFLASASEGALSAVRGGRLGGDAFPRGGRIASGELGAAEKPHRAHRFQCQIRTWCNQCVHITAVTGGLRLEAARVDQGVLSRKDASFGCPIVFLRCLHDGDAQNQGWILPGNSVQATTIEGWWKSDTN